MGIQVYPALTRAIITDGVEDVLVNTAQELQTSSHTNHDGKSVAFAKSDIAAATGYVLIDLSDTTNYPHFNSGELHIDWLVVDYLASATAAGSLQIGFITSIDAAGAEVYLIAQALLDKKEAEHPIQINYSPVGVICGVARHLAGGDAKRTALALFQSDETVEGVYSATTTPAVGDLVLIVNVTAGTVSFSVVAGYHSWA